MQFEKDQTFKKLLYEKKYIEEAMHTFEEKIAIIDKKVKKTQISQDVMP